MPADIMMVVISYNDKYKTFAAIKSLKEQTIDVNIVVWDNASLDGSQHMLMSVPGISVELSKVNKLWSPAINKAIKTYYSGEKYIGFMNNDLTLPADALAKMIETASKDEVGIVSPIGHGLGGKQSVTSHYQDYTGPAERRLSHVVGACCVLRYDVWEQLGPLDERMPLGADDHDYCIRAKHDGFGIYVRTDVIADHKAHSSSGTAEGQVSWNTWGGKSWDAFNTKWDGYYATEDEAVKGHWDGYYHPGWEIGTGWDEDKYNDRVRLGNY